MDVRMDIQTFDSVHFKLVYIFGVQIPITASNFIYRKGEKSY